jgi:hypothetical protein
MYSVIGIGLDLLVSLLLHAPRLPGQYAAAVLVMDNTAQN